MYLGQDEVNYEGLEHDYIADRGALVPVGTSTTGVASTVEMMRDMVKQSALDRQVKLEAATIIWGERPDDKAGQADAIYTYLVKRFKFVDDNAGHEELTSPSIMVRDLRRSGFTIGDCDELSMLQASLLRAVGIPVQFVTWASGNNGVEYDHVFVIAFINGRWVEMDPLPANQMRHVRTGYWPID